MNITDELKNKLKNGVEFDEALAYLREIEASPVQVINAIKETKNISLGEAKALFVESEAWRDVASEADKMHEKLINQIEKDF
jgi:ribosomal protein L7/L12